MNINEQIRKRRLDLGFSEIEVAIKSDLTISEYADIEQYNDEVFTVVHLSNLKRLFAFLSLDLLNVFNIECAFCSQRLGFSPEYQLQRNQLIKKKREEKDMTAEELGERLGFFEAAVYDMERDQEFLESWSVELIEKLSQEIDEPIQILLGVKCSKCGR